MNFVECLSLLICLMFFSSLDLGNVLREEDYKDNMPFLSHLSKDTYHQHD